MVVRMSGTTSIEKKLMNLLNRIINKIHKNSFSILMKKKCLFYYVVFNYVKHTRRWCIVNIVIELNYSRSIKPRTKTFSGR